MYDIGEKICDMHNGLPSKDYDGNPIKVVNNIKIRLDNAEHLVRALLNIAGSDKHKHLDNPYRVDNKYAMIVSNEFGRHQAVWSYDNDWFGMLEFEVVEVEELADMNEDDMDKALLDAGCDPDGLVERTLKRIEE